MIRSLARAVPFPGLLIVLAALGLTAFGLIGVYAAEVGEEGPPAQTLRQLAFLAVGLAGFAAIQLIGYRPIARWAYLLFFLTLVLLTLLLVAKKIPFEPLIHARRNAYRWIVIGPVSIQVSEYARISYVLALAAYLRFKTNYRTLRGLIAPFLLTLLPVGLILKEPDLGTSLLFLPTFFVMLFAAGAKLRHLLLMVVLGLSAAPAFYFSPLMNPYQRARIQSLFEQDDADAHWRVDAGYQLYQSKIALGSGRVAGQGFEAGDFFRHDLLPEEHNDFVFAVLGHQWGFVGCVVVLLFYLLILVAGLTIASMTAEPIGRLLAVGVCALIFVQAVINTGMTIGLMPVTGLSLPFVSMGGSSLVSNYVAIGLLADVGRRQPLDVGPKPFEFDAEDDAA